MRATSTRLSGVAVDPAAFPSALLGLSELDMAEGSQKCTARLKIERVRVKVVLLRRLVAG
jgi:hypothetical protein